MTKENKNLEAIVEELNPRVSAIPDFMEERWEGQIDIVQLIVGKLWESQNPALCQALQTYGDKRAEEERREERERYQELVDWAENVIYGNAFDKETGKIWQHWLDECKRILQTLTNPKDK